MIIKGLFRRYERWNPVHPTSGAFWGMGIGLGCGVGWGPGFGPEAIGYVGAGCGVGFSVGITLIGIGVGLPANSLIAAPYTALVATQNGLVELARLCVSSQRNLAINDQQNRLATRISTLQSEAYGWLANFHNQGLPEDDVGDSSNTHSIVSMNNNRPRVGKAND